MKLLLDTQIALWAVTGDPKLGARAADLIDDADNEVHVSVATIWEIAIKHKLQRGSPNDMPISGAESLGHFTTADFAILPILPEHAVALDAMERLHGHPFDRLLVAQALTEPMHLLTRDARLADYGTLVMQV